MDRVVADYKPGEVTPPGGGNEGADPLAIQYADLGPLALVLNEAFDAVCHVGTDRPTLMDSIANLASCSTEDLGSVLSGDTKCPPQEVLSAFSVGLAIDLDTILDAASRGGCSGYFPNGNPPAVPGY